MRNSRLMSIVGVMIISLAILAVWYSSISWKPSPKDLVLLNSSGFSFTVTLTLINCGKMYPDDPTPCRWRWETEFWLENRYERELELHVVLEIDGYSAASDMRKDIIMPNRTKKRIELHRSLNTDSKTSIPQGVYRIFANTEIKRKKGNMVKTYTFEWDLATGLVNKTTRTFIPDTIPGEE